MADKEKIVRLRNVTTGVVVQVRESQAGRLAGYEPVSTAKKSE